MTARLKDILNRSDAKAGRRRGFTLIELLVVISIIVVLLALAVPLFSVLRGGRSVDAGQNIVSAMLQRARARAIWVQERRGIFFFDDQVTGKTAMLIVRILDTSSSTPPILEVDDQNPDPEYMPLGIGAAFVLPPGTTSGSSTTTTDYHPFGLIVFDGLGRIENLGNYKLKVGSSLTSLVQQFGKNIDGSGLGVIATLDDPSETAMVLYDRRGFTDQGAPTSSVKFSLPQQDWLDKNGLVLVVNRYNGTLIRGE